MPILAEYILDVFLYYSLALLLCLDLVLEFSMYGSDYIAYSLGVLDVVILWCIFLHYGMSLENWVLGDVWLLISCGLCLPGL